MWIMRDDIWRIFRRKNEQRSNGLLQLAIHWRTITQSFLVHDENSFVIFSHVRCSGRNRMQTTVEQTIFYDSFMCLSPVFMSWFKVNHTQSLRRGIYCCIALHIFVGAFLCLWHWSFWLFVYAEKNRAQREWKAEFHFINDDVKVMKSIQLN